MLMFLSKMRKSKWGYTLTELIVVISVLGILAVVASPFVADYVGRATKSADDANARVIEDVLKRVKADTGKLPATEALIEAAILVELKPIPVPKADGMKFILEPATCTVKIDDAADADLGEIDLTPPDEDEDD